jgi:hypothetical protein
MAKPIGIVDVEHSTSKPGIRELGALKGKGNRDALVIASQTYAPGKLVFLGFVAPPPADLSPGEKIWDGVLRFEAGESAAAERCDFGVYVNAVCSDPETEMDGET